MVLIAALMRRSVVMMVLERLRRSGSGSAKQHAAGRIALEGHGDKQQAGDGDAQDAIHVAKSKRVQGAGTLVLGSKTCATDASIIGENA